MNLAQAAEAQVRAAIARMTNPTALRISLNVDALSTVLIAALDTALTYTLNGIGSIATENIGNSLLKTGATELRVGGSTNGITGYCDEFRLRKEAVYLADFTPPPLPFAA